MKTDKHTAAILAWATRRLTEIDWYPPREEVPEDA